MGLHHIQPVAPVGCFFKEGADPGRFLILQGMSPGDRNHFYHLHHPCAGFLHSLTEGAVFPVDLGSECHYRSGSHRSNQNKKHKDEPVFYGCDRQCDNEIHHNIKQIDKKLG